MISLPARLRRSLRGATFGPTATVAVTLLLFVAVYALRLLDGNVADVPLLLFVVPIAVAAIRFGVRGGVLAALFGLALTSSWHLMTDHPLGAPGFLTRATALLFVGALVGRFADDRRKLEATIRGQEDLSLDLIATADFDGYFTRVNPSWERILGYSRQELVSRPFLDFVHPDDHEATIREATKLADEGADVVNFQNRYRASDGSYRWLEWMSRSDPQARRIYAVARDVTTRKQAEDSILFHQEMLERAVRERTAELEEARLETLRRLALAAEYRDDDTFQHTERVGELAARLAEQLGLSDQEILLYRRAAPLHDVGKLGISDTILLKPGKLTEDEFDLIKGHAAAGAAILAGSSSRVLQLAEQIALTHHEWWDGTGYPYELEGEQIPLSGRVVGLVDVFDALTHARPYKPPWPLEQAIAELHRLRGRQFDPVVVEAFDAVIDDETRLTKTAHPGTGANGHLARVDGFGVLNA